MGKRIEYTSFPKKPRAAKLAWNKFEGKRGTPECMYFDVNTEEWVALYKGVQVKESDL